MSIKEYAVRRDGMATIIVSYPPGHPREWRPFKEEVTLKNASEFLSQLTFGVEYTDVHLLVRPGVVDELPDGGLLGRSKVFELMERAEFR